LGILAKVSDYFVSRESTGGAGSLCRVIGVEWSFFTFAISANFQRAHWVSPLEITFDPFFVGKIF
jgi:hypothetical protein